MMGANPFLRVLLKAEPESSGPPAVAVPPSALLAGMSGLFNSTPMMPRMATPREYVDNPATISALSSLYGRVQSTFNPFVKYRPEHLIAIGQDGKAAMTADASPGDVRQMQAAIPAAAQFIVHSHPAGAQPNPSPADYEAATKLGRPNFVLSQNALYVAMPGQNPNTLTHVKVADVRYHNGQLQLNWH